MIGSDIDIPIHFIGAFLAIIGFFVGFGMILLALTKSAPAFWEIPLGILIIAVGVVVGGLIFLGGSQEDEADSDGS